MGNEAAMFSYVKTALAGLRAFATSNNNIKEHAPKLYDWLIAIPQESRKEFLPIAMEVTTHYLLASAAPVKSSAYMASIDKSVTAGLSIGEDAGKKTAARAKAQRLAGIFGLKFAVLEEKI